MGLSGRSKKSNKSLRFFDPKEVPTNQVQNWMIGQYLLYGLCSRKLAKKFVNRTIGELIYFERVWLALEDNLLFSSPENFVTKTWVIKRYFRFTMGLLAYGGYSAFMKVLKRGYLHIENTVAMKITSEEVRLPGSWPGSRDHKIIYGPDWLIRLMRDGPTEKSEITRLASFISTRNFPPPRKEESRKELTEHHEKLKAVLPPVPEERLEIIRLLGKRIAQKTNKRSLTNRVKPLEHLSVTNRSSFTSTRSEGGRAAEIRIEFEIWANRKASETHVKRTLWGPNVCRRAGVPNWRSYTIKPIREIEKDCDFLEEVEDPSGLKVLAGLNHNFGIQLLECAFEEGIRRELWNEEGEVSKENLPFVRTAVCREPGNKSRIYTIDEWFVTLLLQPLGHLLVGTLETVIEATHGLKAGNAAWEWVQRFHKKPKELTDYYNLCYLLTSDLETATDYCDFQVVRAVLEGYLDGLGILDGNRYLRFAISLLTAGINLITELPR